MAQGRPRTDPATTCMPHVQHRKGHQGNQAAQAHSCPQSMMVSWMGERWRLVSALARPQEGKTSGALSQCCLHMPDRATRTSRQAASEGLVITLNVA